MRLQQYILGFIILTYTVRLARAKKRCDVRIWYLNIITDDVFNLDLTKEQLSLKYSIESLVLKASENKETRMVDCSVLYMYNGMLLDLFNYTPSGSGMSLTEVETEELPQTHTDAVPDSEADSLKAADIRSKDEHSEYENENVHDETVLNEKTSNSIHTITEGDEASQDATEPENEQSTKDPDEKESTQVETEGQTNQQNTVNKDDIINTNTESTKESVATNTVKLSDLDTENLESQETVFMDDSDHAENAAQTDETDHFTTGDTHDHFEYKAENIDETELVEDTDHELTLSSDPSQETLSFKHSEEAIQGEPVELEDTFVSKAIPFGVCWSFGCLVSDIFDVYSTGIDNSSNKLEYQNEHASGISNKNRNEKKHKFECPLRPICTMKCFYIFLLSNSFCMKDSEYVSFRVDGEEELALKKHALHEEVITDTVLETEGPTDNIYKTSDTVKSSTDFHKDAQITRTDLKAENIKSEEKPYISTSQKEQMNHKTAINEESKWTVTEFENIVEQKTSKYHSKLQTIEVMIMKLENKLLMEALNKQNHTSTITKLENQILKLENELLKMNKNYQNLQDESLRMSKRQNKYLELAYKKARNEYPKLSDHSNMKFELISQHQAKINELAEVLRNQSGIIIQLKEKHDTLEDQNRMLQQMVMDQTLLMTSIMKNVQDLTEQNVRTQKELNNLKQTLEKNVVKETKYGSKEGVIDQLDSLLFNKRTKTEELENKVDYIYNTEQTKTLYPKNYHGYQSTYTSITEWCPKDNKTCPTCHYTSIINSHCTPFQNIIWSKCKTEHLTREQISDSDFPPIPIVKDEQTDDKNDSELPIPKNKNDFEPRASNYQVKQETIEEDLDITQKDVRTKTNDDPVYVDVEKPGDINENEELKQYVLVGYDKDGKPVLKVREDTVKKKLNEIKQENINSLKSESENKINEKNERTKTVFAENVNMIEKQLTEDNNVNNVQEMAKDVLEMQIKVSKETSNVKTENRKEHISNKAKIPKSDQDRSVQAKGVKNMNTKDVDTKKEKDNPEQGSDNTDQIPEHSSDSSAQVIADNNSISISQKDNLGSKSTEPKDDSKKNVVKSVVNEVKNDFKKGSDEEKLQNNLAQQKPSASSTTVEKKEVEKKEQQKEKQKATNTENKERKVPINLNTIKQTDPKDCYDHYRKGERKDGLFKVKPLGSDKVIEVFCDMRRGGWTVIQRRQDGTTNFFKDWDDYRRGFGGLYGEHWLGNDNIHLLTNQDYYKLRVDLMDWDKNKKYAEFNYFLVENEDEAYRLHIDGYTGDAGDGFTKHSGSKFSTKDVDNDKVVKEFGGSCANRFYGAGWYFKCYASNLNGRFYKGGKIPEKRFDGVTWKPWTGPNYSLKKVEMKIQPASVSSS